jgi:hypothetical protein
MLGYKRGGWGDLLVGKDRSIRTILGSRRPASITAAKTAQRSHWIRCCLRRTRTRRDSTQFNGVPFFFWLPPE